MNGAGAASIAITRLLLSAGFRNIIMCDRTGIIYAGREEGMNPIKDEMARVTNLKGEKGSLANALIGADAFIGVSAPKTVTKKMVSSMAKDSIVFACANPTPEIFPEDAKAAGARVVATGRSDYPNQVNNVLAFPGILKGVLSVRASAITDAMKEAASRAIASVISEEELQPDYVLPDVFDPRVVDAVVDAVVKEAAASGADRR